MTAEITQQEARLLLWTDDEPEAIYSQTFLLADGVKIKSRLFLDHLTRVLAARMGGGLILPSAQWTVVT